MFVKLYTYRFWCEDGKTIFVKARTQNEAIRFANNSGNNPIEVSFALPENNW